MEAFDAITYFFFNLGLLNVLLALTAFILGLILGWLIWAKYKKQINAYIQQQKKYESEISQLKSKHSGLEAKLKEKTTAFDSLQVKYEESSTQRKNLEGDLQKGQLYFTKIENELADCKSRLEELEGELLNDQQIISNLRSELKQCQAASDESGDLEAQLEACQRNCSNLEAERSELKSKLGSLAAVTMPTVGFLASDVEEEESTEQLKAKSRAFFNEAIETGKMREDVQYGLLYNSAPEKEDDLTRIKGVAGVLKGTLNGYGVYTFRQIALWTPQICEDFSEKIAFRGRVERDDWIGQCKQFHKEKYGEAI